MQPSLCFLLTALLGATSVFGATPAQNENAPARVEVHNVEVRNTDELRAAVRTAIPNTRILLAPGEYSGGNWFENVRGEAERPIVIGALDSKNPPLIKGGGVGFQFAGAQYLEVRDLRIEDIQGDGLKVDDAGVREKPAHHIVIRNIVLKDIGMPGTWHCIKMAGVDDFRIENCRFEGWGAGKGQGIDGVGCHQGLVQNNVFKDRPQREDQGFGAIQFKGASRDITIRRNRFEDTGFRSINIGGSTGVPFFRPPLEIWPEGQARYEAKDIIVEGNTFIGSDAPVAFVNTDGAVVRFNTIYAPHRWALRILQETQLPGFVPSRKGAFSDNIVVFRSGEWFEGGVNIGPNTAPETFQFARNWWFCADNPSRSRPTLPTPETDGTYGQDPLFRDATAGDFRLQPQSPAAKVGAEALPTNNS